MTHKAEIVEYTNQEYRLINGHCTEPGCQNWATRYLLDETGKRVPSGKLCQECAGKIIREYRQLLETHQKFVAALNPSDKPARSGTANAKAMQVKELNVFFDNVPQEQRIAKLKEIANANGPNGDSEPGGAVQEADYTELPKQGDGD